MHHGKYVQSCHRIENNILNMFKNILHIKQNKERLLIAKK